MVKQWAEKEVRNLKRLRAAGLNVPEAYLLKNNVILMEFIGDQGLAAPRLKDAGLTEEQHIKAYFDVLKLMRKMLQDCKMVHGDLSEYNMLYFKDEIYIIDVSQSVELDHPMALDFLRRDWVNVNDYFDRQNIQVLSTEKTFDFITDIKVQESQVDDVLRSLLEQNLAELSSLTLEEKRKLEVNDKVFQNVHIPRSLQEMSLEDLDRLGQNKQKDDLVMANTDVSAPAASREFRGLESTLPQQQDDDEEEGSESEGEAEEDKTEADSQSIHSTKKQKQDPFDGMSKKERKQKVKEENRERRKNKIPKHIKKRMEKKGGNKK